MEGVNNQSRSASFMPTAVMAASGGLAIVLGVLIIVLTSSASSRWANLDPSLVGTPFNSALLFILAGAALCARALHYTQACLGLGIAVVTVGVLTAFQHLTGLDLRIDQIFFRHTLAVESHTPGRMAANAALCFIMSGICIAIIGWQHRFSSRKLVLGLLGSIVLLLGLDAAAGFFTGVQVAFRWGEIPMSGNTAMGFILVGTGILAYVCRHAREQGIFSPSWLSKVAGTVMLAIAFGQWQTLVQREASHLERITKIQATHFGRNIELRMSEMHATLKQLAARWEQMPTSDKVWKAEAAAFVHTHSFIEAIVRFNETGKVVAVYPEKIKLEPPAQRSLAEASPTRIEYTKRAKGERGQLELHVGMTRNGKPAGSTVALVNTRMFVNSVLSSWAMPRYAVEISSGPDLVFTGGGTPSSRTKQHEQTAFVSLDKIAWLVRIQPTMTEIRSYLTNLPETALFVAVLVALLLTLSIRISEARYQLSTIVNAFDEAIIGLDLNGKIVTWSSGASRIFGYTSQEAIGNQFAILVPKELAEEADTLFGRVRRGEKLYKFRTKRVRKDGSLVDISVSMSPIHDSFGQIIGISSIARDIWDEAQKEAWRKQHWAKQNAAGAGTDKAAA